MLKIIKSSREDILRRKAAYEQERSERQARYDSQRNQYNAANKGVIDALRDIIYAQLPDKELDVKVFPNAGKFYRVEITNDSEYEQGGSALHWSYSAELDYDGNLRTESNSWSGLEATTIYNIQDLKRTVATLETLIDMDWQTILEDAVAPEYKDYVTESNPSNEAGPDFDTELLIDDAQSNIGSDIWFKGKDSRGREAWINFLGETPKYFKVAMMYVPKNADDDFIRDAAARTKKYPQNIRKDQIAKFLTVDCETMEVES